MMTESAPDQTLRWFVALALGLWAWRLWAADITAADFPRVTLVLPGATVEVALADTAQLRGIGYQHVRASEAPDAIYFRYPEPRQVHFHMRNVAFAVRAYWIEADYCVSGHVDMAPGQSGYRPPAPVVGVLEVAAFADAVPELATGQCLEPQFRR